MINALWYKNAVIYCLSVATYMDANGDGSGDFQGLMRRLDYLQGLGDTTGRCSWIWLRPRPKLPSSQAVSGIACNWTTQRHKARLRRRLRWTSPSSWVGWIA